MSSARLINAATPASETTARRGRCACGRPIVADGRCASCSLDRGVLQRRSTSTARAREIPPIVHEILGSHGAPLDRSTRDHMEPMFDHDFSGVRLHTDRTAAESARAVGADAYTVGSHIAFAAGRYAPGSSQGRSLLAHELAHVVQQSGARLRGPLQISPADHPTEAAAARAADAVTSGWRPPPLTSGSPREGRLSRLPASPASAGVSSIEISCATNTITFHSGSGSVGYRLTKCDVTDGTYDAGVTVHDNDVTFDLGSKAAEGRRFLFEYAVDPGQPSPASLLGTQESVRIQARSGAPAGEGQGVLGSIPVTYVATGIPSAPPVPPGSSETGSATQPQGVPGFPASVVGLGGHVLASGDLSWLSRADAVRRVLGPEYWRPFLPQAGNVIKDRIVEQLPRDLRPRIEAELAAGQPLSWVRRGFTEEQLASIPELIERLNAKGVGGLTQAELDFLRKAAAMHGGPKGGASPGSPLVSLSESGVPVSLDDKLYRVRVEVPKGQALDLSGPSPINDMGRLKELMNVEEAEFLIAKSAEGRITSVQRLAAGAPDTPPPSLMLRYSGAIRWGGRLVFLGGLGLSTWRIADAAPGQRQIVVGEEVGGQIGGFAGTAIGVGGCVLFGIATGGVGLFLCGLTGGALLGYGGSLVGGAMAEGSEPSTVCPSCHALQREWEARAQRRTVLPGITTAANGELQAAELERLRQWLEALPEQAGQAEAQP